MKIAILGTRGIPNHYGGFEQYAELLSVYLARQGWDVSVFNAHNHPYQEQMYKGVKIIHVYDPEYKMGTAGQFIYDLGCIRHTRKEHFDIIYQLGYTSSAIFNFLFKKDSLLVTNMDGLEWKRSKYNKYVRRFLKYSERLAVKHSDYLIADSIGIKNYLDEKYKRNSFFSAYTADIPASFNEDLLTQYGLTAGSYNLLIARLEPENNVDVIMEAHTLNACADRLIVVGNAKTAYGEMLRRKYAGHSNIVFIGGVYEKEKVDALRRFSRMYFHGHSVGGTNPSLLEAMAASCNIIANDNIFNRSVLKDDALYFSTAADLNAHIRNFATYASFFERAAANNLRKIAVDYSENKLFELLKEKLNELAAQKSSS